MQYKVPEIYVEVIRFYDMTFADQALQKTLLAAPNLEAFKDLIMSEAGKRGFTFSREQLDETFDGRGERNTFSKFAIPSPWIIKIMNYGWAPKGYSR